MKGALLDGGEGREDTPEAGTTTSRPLARFISYSCSEIAIVFGSCYAAFIIYITATYPRGWMERLQMLPLCVVAVMAPMLGTVMLRK